MPTKTFYCDAETEEALKFLAVDFHEPKFSAVVRMAIHETAEAHRRAALRRECELLMSDPEERRMAKELAAELELISVW